MDTAIFEKYGLRPLEPILATGQITMWKMTQPAINRTVLVHVLESTITSDPDAVSYLFSVARCISNAAAPAIAQIYTIFDEPDLKAIVSEYVDGLSLEHAVSALGPLSMKQTVRTGIAVAEALKAVWDASHIIYGSVRPEFVTLDAGSTAKLISPCYAQVAPEDIEVPESDMSDLGELLYFLATGVHPGQAHTVSLPHEFSSLLERLSSKNQITRFASWDGVIEALRALEDIQPAAAKGGEGGKRFAVKRGMGASAGTAPKVVKQGGSARLSAEDSNTIEAVRKAARERAMAAEKKSSGLKFFAGVVLILVIAGVLVLRIGVEELDVRMANLMQGGRQSVDEPKAPQVQNGDSPTASVEEPTVSDMPAAGTVADDAPDAAEDVQDVLDVQQDGEPDTALDRYLAAHVGEEVPFVHKGVEHTVTLVGYTADTVTIRTRKVFTLNRSELTPEQLELWK